MKPVLNVEQKINPGVLLGCVHTSLEGETGLSLPASVLNSDEAKWQEGALA